MTTSQKVTTWYIGPGNRAKEPPNPHRNRPIQPRVRKTAINDAFRNGASMREVREFAEHADIRTTEVCVIRNVRMRRQEPKASIGSWLLISSPTLPDAVPGRSIGQVAQDRPNPHRLS